MRGVDPTPGDRRANAFGLVIGTVGVLALIVAVVGTVAMSSSDAAVPAPPAPGVMYIDSTFVCVPDGTPEWDCVPAPAVGTDVTR